MSDYINRADALAELCYKCTSLRGCGTYHSECDEYKALSSIPAADVRENVCGRWTRSIGGQTVCSNCWKCPTDGLDAQIWNDWFPQFCPWCGADMRVLADNLASAVERSAEDCLAPRDVWDNLLGTEGDD